MVLSLTALFNVTAHAISLNYSGGSSSNSTGASATTSGYSVSYDDTNKNLCGYRFSVVTSSGVPKSGTKPANVYLEDSEDGSTAYSSGQRFIISSGKVANKKQLSNDTEIKSSKTKQSCDFKSSSCGFYSNIPLDPSDIGTWIKKINNGYQNLQRIYIMCGTKLAEATESDYVLIEPIFWVKLANVKTAVTPTELAVYGAAISGGDEYNGANGNLSDGGTTTIRNICNYVNREFPNALYVSSDNDVYSEVTIKTSGRYKYKNIINKGYGCSVLTVKNVVPISKVKIAYHPNGGTASKAELNSYGYMTIDDEVYVQTIKHGNKADPFNASTFGLTRVGYKFAGWEVKSTGNVLDQSTEYASTKYAQYDDKTKTTANTSTVYCHLYAKWTPNKVQIAYHPNGGTASKAELNSYGYMTIDDEVYVQTIKYGNNADPYNASKFGLTRAGYKFVGWEVKSTGQVLNQSTEYASTVYAQHNDKTKTTANTTTVSCHLIAKWEPNKVQIAYHPNGGSASKAGLNAYGFMTIDDEVYVQTIKYGNKANPYNASKFGLTREGYKFAGWEVKSTGEILNQSSEYASTVYAQHNDKTKTTANTAMVTCYLYAKWTPNKVKIAYHPNGGSTTKSTNSNGFILIENEEYIQNINYGSKAAPVNASTFELTKEGYEFAGWEVKSTGQILDQNTEYDSTLYAQYDDENKTTENSEIVYCHLYAKWTSHKVNISYHPNGGAVSKATINSNGFIVLNSSVYIHSIGHGTKADPYNASTFGLTREGYVFDGWEVKSTGRILDQDTEYVSTVYRQYNDSNKSTENTKTVCCHLYAKWKPNKVNIAYHSNGGTATNAELNGKGFMILNDTVYVHSIKYGSKVDPYNPSTFGLTREGFEFIGWEVKSTGDILDPNTEYESTKYAQHDSEKKTTANTDIVYCHLYAKWEPNKVQIAYHPNGGTASKAGLNTYGFMTIDDKVYVQTIKHGTNADPINASTFGLTRVGYKFAGWEVKSTGRILDHNTEYASTVYAQHDSGSKTTKNTKLVSCYLYAKWVPNTVKIAYHPNGGTTTKDVNSNGYIILNDEVYFQTLQHGSKVDPYNDSTLGLTKAGYKFAGWKVKSTGRILNQDTEYVSTLYAQHDNSSKTTENTETVYCHLIAVWEKEAKIVIVPIEPNAQYREKTYVVSSFWLVNISGEDYTPSKNAKVVFSVYNSSGEKIAGETQNFVTPNENKNLSYFKWFVPDNYASSKITVKAHILEGENEYGNVENNYTVAAFETCKTPDTSYKDKAPEGFSIPTGNFDNDAQARWWQWEYIGDSFIKNEYAVKNIANDIYINTSTNPTAHIENGNLYTKSGYGFGCEFVPQMLTVDGYELNSATKCTAPQCFYALFPEYNYAYGVNKCRSFETVSGIKKFVYDNKMKRQHFTPIYYPDGEYKFQIVVSDCWTPSGMLTTYKTLIIQIDGNMYDDWYVGRK